jgi:hypothetical protein
MIRRTYVLVTNSGFIDDGSSMDSYRLQTTSGLFKRDEIELFTEMLADVAKQVGLPSEKIRVKTFHRVS